MGIKAYPVIDLVATGNNIRRLRLERGLTVRDLQSYFGFEEPRAIYKWQKGESLPTVENLYALGNLYDRLFWIRQESDATSTICSVCIVGGVTSHAFNTAHGEEDQYMIIVIS